MRLVDRRAPLSEAVSVRAALVVLAFSAACVPDPAPAARAPDASTREDARAPGVSDDGDYLMVSRDFMRLLRSSANGGPSLRASILSTKSGLARQPTW